MTTYFISDLHLSDHTPSLNTAFSDFLLNTAIDADQIFILGDLFESWLGDDDDSAIGKRVAEIIRTRADAGTHVFLMRGNRDFMLTQAWAESLGAQLLADPSILNIEGIDIALLHGDTLCTDDNEYQRYRRIIQHPLTRKLLAKLPLSVRKQISGGLRAKSTAKNSVKATDIMDVNIASVERFCRDNNLDTIIHGHTHRPAVHEEKTHTRYVLGDWAESLWFIKMSDNGVELKEQAI